MPENTPKLFFFVGRIQRKTTPFTHVKKTKPKIEECGLRVSDCNLGRFAEKGYI